MSVEGMNRGKEGEEWAIAEVGFEEEEEDVVEGGRSDVKGVPKGRATERNATEELGFCGV